MGLDHKFDQKVFDYIASLEKTNAELLKTLRICVEALSKFESSAPDPEGFQELMDTFYRTIRVAERTIGDKPFH